MKISNLRIGVRLGSAFALMVVLLVGTAVVGIEHLESTNTKMDEIVSNRYTLIALSNQIKSNGYKANGILSNLLLTTSPDRAKQYMDDYAAIRKANAQAYAELEKHLTSDETKALFKQQFDARSAYGVSVKSFFDLVSKNQ